MNLKLKFTKNQKGLTLIELLVVIVILGIIAAIAIAIPMVMGQQDDASKSTNAQNISIVQDAVNRYYTLNNNYPTKLVTLTNTENGNTDKGGPFIKEVPELKTFEGCSARTGAEFGWNYNTSTGNVYADPKCLTD